jgi:hypothetical protein
MKHLLFVVSLVIFSNSFSQNTAIKKNSLSLELAGTQLIYSINYDRIFYSENKLHLAANVGLSYIPPIENYIDMHIAGWSLGWSTLYGKTQHFAELGINFTMWSMLDIEDNFFINYFQPLKFGYRYISQTNRLSIRAAIMPIVSIYQDPDAEFLYPITPHFSLSVGYAF